MDSYVKEPRVAVVTGANKGIGFEICRQLAHRGVQIFLTARDRERGEAAAEKLCEEGGKVIFRPLDVSDAASIQSFKRSLEIDRLDILVNNAGVFGTANGALSVKVPTVEEVLRTNTLGPLQVIQALVPLLKRSRQGRVINISSGMGALSEMSGGYAAYRISKAALNALSLICASELREASIAVNSMCPGWVKTDMGGPDAPRSVVEGADTAVWLALDAPQDLTGKFIRDRKEIAW